MSAKQKRHSKFFKGYTKVLGEKKLQDLSAEKGDVEVNYELGDVMYYRNINEAAILERLACAADTVVLGTVQNKSSQLIEDGTFTFTDYELHVEEVIKDNKADPIQSGSNITITRPGGSVLLNGHTIRAVDFRRGLLMPKERYLLFLKYLPDTNSYFSFSDTATEDTFHLQGGKVSHTTQKQLPLGRGLRDETAFITDVRNALTMPCNK